jgi:hypothetical protein
VAVVAATDAKRAKAKSTVARVHSAKRALTAAALALPGLLQASTDGAVDDELGLQYGYYSENERDLNGVKSKYKPIEAESLRNNADLSVSDRVNLIVNFTQDTWSGATPISTAPADMRSNRSIAVDGITGASPFINGALFFDAATDAPLQTDGYGNVVGGVDTGLVHTMSGASPETRKQVDFKLTREWDDFAVSFGGGTSQENDYDSNFVNVGVRRDVNQRLTTLNWGLSYTDSKTDAVLDHDAVPYIYDACMFTCNAPGSPGHIDANEFGKRVLTGSRDDWGTHVGVTQVLDRNSVLDADLAFTRSRGYMSNPYKVVEIGFIDPDQQFFAPDGTYYATFNAILENRPESRNAGTAALNYTRFFEGSNGALHVRYRYFQDDWEIRAHTLALDWSQPLGRGWTVTPYVRYYSQSEADFYVPYLVTDQAQSPRVVDPVKGQVYFDANNPDQKYYDDPNVANPDGFNPYTGDPVVDANGNPVSQEIADSLILETTPFDRSKIPDHYSSDHRLTAFGAIAAGLTLSVEFTPGATLELGYERYTHEGSLRIGGGGAPGYTDFRYEAFNATVKVDLGAAAHPTPVPRFHEAANADSGGSAAHHDHVVGGGAPAGVMYDHMLSRAGDFMIGYRYRYAQQEGDMMHGTNHVSLEQVKASGCGTDGCLLAPEDMAMHMYMLELMYAPTTWLNVMVMPEYVDMHMQMNGLLTPEELGNIDTDLANLYRHHTLHEQTTGGFGDTTFMSLVRLFDDGANHAHVGFGFSAPTGDADSRLRDTHGIDAGFVHYGMQTGNGTWDFLPNLTYTGHHAAWNWGAQFNAAIRLEGHNDSGFAFGDTYQTTAWAGYALTRWLTASLRGEYTTQSEIHGEYDDTYYRLAPNDYPSNYGGDLFDVGIGFNAVFPDGALKGNRIDVEWLQPVRHDVNGYQLSYKGSLVVTWSISL